MKNKDTVYAALKLMPKTHEDFPVDANTLQSLRSAWSHAVRGGRVVELPDLHEGNSDTFILHRDVGRELSDARLIDDPFCPAPWIAIQRVRNKKVPDHHEDRAFLFQKMEEGAYEGKVLFIMLALVGGFKAYTHSTSGLFDFEHGSGPITMDPMLVTHLKNKGFSGEDSRKMLETFANQGWGTYSTILGFLNTRGVKYQVTETKLNKKGAIIKAGRIVPKNLYVTHIKESAGKVIPRGAYIGSHASPTPHLRRGHVRNLPDGNTTWVRPCMVNVASSDELAFLEQARSRSHYMIK